MSQNCVHVSSSDGSEFQILRLYEEKDELYPWDVLKKFIWHTLDEEDLNCHFDCLLGNMFRRYWGAVPSWQLNMMQAIL